MSSVGVDVAVSTPRIMSALVEEAVTVGEIVRLLTFKKGTSSLVELTLPDDSPVVGRRVRDVEMPVGVVLVAIVRDGVPRAPERCSDGGRGELLLVSLPDAERLRGCWPATSPPTAPVTSAETASPAITALSVDERSLRTIHAQSAATSPTRRQG